MAPPPPDAPPLGIHLIHKPVGPSSFAALQSHLSTIQFPAHRRPPRACHGGTLDPFASGLLLVLIEPATRLFDYLHDVPKTYTATIAWGVETESGDLHGRIISQGDPSALTPAQLDDALSAFAGWTEQVPPATSNKRVGGERAYAKAHRGEAVQLPPSRVFLHEARWIEHDLPRSSRLRVTVRGGFYVRAMVRDLGRSLGCGAHITQLHRDAIGPWLDPGLGHVVHLRGRDILPWCPTRVLLDQELGDLRAGKPIPAGDLIAPDWPLPAGFPPGNPPVRAFHRDRFCFLLKPAPDALLTPIASLRGL